MSKIKINTSQNVDIEFTLASVGERMLAFLVDTFVQAAYLITVFYVLYEILDAERFFETLDNWSIIAIIGVMMLPVYTYSLVCESLMEGQTFGKKIMKIRTVKIDGYQASFGDYLMRWLFMIVDVFTNGGMIGLLFIILSKNNQRLGDIVAGTAVITLKNKVNISHTILENLEQNYVPSYPQVVALSDNDMRIIKENYQRAKATYDGQVMQKLSNKIKEILKLEVDHTELTDRKFVELIIKDYNYYTGEEN